MFPITMPIHYLNRPDITLIYSIRRNQSPPSMQERTHSQGQGNAGAPPSQQDGVVSFSRQPPPTLLRINADNQDKRAICLFWIIFFAVIISITIASSFLPKGTYRMENKPQLKQSILDGCANPNFFDNDKILRCGSSNSSQLGAVALNLRRENQFVVLFWKFMVVDNRVEMPDIETNLTIFDYLLDKSTKDNSIAYLNQELQQTKSTAFTFKFRKADRIYGEDGRTVVGFEQPILVMRNFLEESHLFVIQNSAATPFPNVSEVIPEILTVNTEFTKYSIIIRYLYFGLSLIACVVYMVMLRRVPSGEKIVEQKMIAVLSVLLIFFNDPFYPITVMFPNKASSYFSVFFVINFVIFLMFFWIIFLDRMYYEDGQKQTNLLNKKRIIYIVATYILVLVLYTLIAMDHIEGLPIVRTEELTSNKYIGLELISLLVVVLGFSYIVFTYIRLCIKADQLLWRNQLFLFFSVFFIVMVIALFFVNGFEINSFAGNRILLLFTMMNMYVFYMQYMYTISKEERDRVNRGQLDRPEMGLLEVKSGEDDCVDLSFDDSIGSKIHTQDKLNQFVDRNKHMQEQRSEQRQEDQMYSPKYGKSYEKDLQYNIQPNAQTEDEKQTDFFKENHDAEEEEPKHVQKQAKKKDDFDQYSLDD